MIETITNLGRGIGREVFRTWETVVRGWRELLNKSGSALTQFRPRGDMGATDCADENFPTWSLLAGEVADTGRSIIVRLELPGMNRDDFSVSIDNDVLYVSGEKRLDRELFGASYYVMERAYGNFSRAIPMPVPVEASRAKASYRNGVLAVEAPKICGAAPRRLTIH